MTTLVIVESPTKAKTIEKMLGKGYTVKSSFGHIRDLPKSKLGVDTENDFKPNYITIRGKGDIIKILKDETKKASCVLLASDPDREGEAIAWHLKETLEIKDEKCRIEFNEITSAAVKNAAKNPRPIDMDRVDAQQARRILDRLVGYKISPLLWKNVKKGLSGGRVQSVVVRLICDREAEINKFITTEYWVLKAELASNKGVYSAKLIKIADKKAEISTAEEMKTILDYLRNKQFIVTRIQKKEKKLRPQPPFTTSTLQQEASKRFSLTARKTMQIAQELYEGIRIDNDVIGLITYMRTDSVRVSEDAQKEAQEYIKRTFGSDYYPKQPNQYSSKGKIQNAHEAIRPSSVERTPSALKAYLSPAQYKLYKLIWERFVASQMSQAVFDSTVVEIAAGNCLFSSAESILRFPGFRQVYILGKEDDDEASDNNLSELITGMELKIKQMEPSQHFTQPPPRYMESSLVKELEELGIGRPSTYAPIIETICSRGYVMRQEKQFFPTELGEIVVDLLKEYFPNIMNVDFTAEMEKDLDMVEEGEIQWQKLMTDFYLPFSETLQQAEVKMSRIVIALEESGDLCEKCGKPMVYRMGRNGKFLACSGFPECRNAKAITKPIGVKCLACDGNILERKSRSNRIFYGCDRYPECTYTAWDMPIEEKCPLCETQYTIKVRRQSDKEDAIKHCPNKECPSNIKTADKPKRTPTKSKVKKSAKKKNSPAL